MSCPVQEERAATLPFIHCILGHLIQRLKLDVTRCWFYDMLGLPGCGVGSTPSEFGVWCVRCGDPSVYLGVTRCGGFVRSVALLSGSGLTMDTGNELGCPAWHLLTSNSHNLLVSDQEVRQRTKRLEIGPICAGLAMIGGQG